MSVVQVPAHSVTPYPVSPVSEILANLTEGVPAMAQHGISEVGERIAAMPSYVGSVLVHEHEELAPRLVHAMADLATMVWSSFGRTGTMRFSFDGAEHDAPCGAPHWSATPVTWQSGLFATIIARHQPGLAASLAHPAAHFEGIGSAQRDAYHLPFVEGLRGVLLGEPGAHAYLQAAHRGTQPQNLRVASPRWAALTRSVIEMLDAIVRRDSVTLREAGVRGLAAHRSIWSRADQVWRHEGQWCLPVTAMAALAVEWGLPWEIDSGYVPQVLVYRRPS